MDWTDVHYRQLARLISKHTWLYTEMVVDKTIIHTQQLDKFLAFPPEQSPIVLQLGGSDPTTLAQACLKAKKYGYDEVNLNCGCPSDRVAGAGCFGASLMREHEVRLKNYILPIYILALATRRSLVPTASSLSKRSKLGLSWRHDGAMYKPGRTTPSGPQTSMCEPCLKQRLHLEHTGPPPCHQRAGTRSARARVGLTFRRYSCLNDSVPVCPEHSGRTMMLVSVGGLGDHSLYLLQNPTGLEDSGLKRRSLAASSSSAAQISA